MSVFHKSIGALLFAAFFALSLIVAVQGIFAFGALQAFGDLGGVAQRADLAAAISQFRFVLIASLAAAILLVLTIAALAIWRIARPSPEAVTDRIAEMRLTDALETSDEGVMLVDSAGAVVVLNNRLRSFFPGVAEQLVPGSHYRYVNALIHSQFAGQDEFLRGPTEENGEHRLGDGRWVRVSVNPTSEGGRIVFVSDFTDIKQREESFKQAKHDAEAASESKSRFLANMSHELRTPLNAIIGFSEILSSQIFGTLGNPRYVEYSTDIMRSGRHLLEVINSVLDLSKSEAGKMELKPQAIDLADVLEDCVRMVREQCAEARLDLRVSGIDQELPVFGEAAKLRQIFLNLLSNAAKFTEAGGRIELGASSDGETVSATIADSGIGMSPGDVQVALTAFGQVDNRLERKYEGTGLGLPLAKSFVELHGGSLHIESAVGQGTRVTVRLARNGLAAARSA